ncbi:MAG: diacylglycerol kinase family lipid kinase [Chloroflexi bacterium]|nr:MAG: diacylglycerol kinase family lipid kinase [Chloroflexota bacterium]
MSGRTVVIVNPASAGGRTGRRWPEVHRCLEGAGVAAEVRVTTAPGQATELARAALGEGCDRVVAAGGDGTLNEVLNGFFDAATGEPVAPGARLGMLPSGTGGDFRRTARIPLDPGAACALLASGQVRRVDIGRIEFHGEGVPGPRHFVNIADCGIGGEVVTRVNRSGKRGGGRSVFLYHSLAALMAYRPRPARVEVDGDILQSTVHNVVIANGRYFGAGMLVAPQASIDDGMLDVVIFEPKPRLRSLREMPRLYRGEHIGRPGVEVRRGRRVTVTSLGEPLLFDVDGEQVGRAPATVSCLRAALLLCAPNSGSPAS